MPNGVHRNALGAIIALTGLGSISSIAVADINLELRPSFQTVNVGDTVSFGLYAVSDGAPQGLSALQVVLGWDPGYLQMMANSKSGAVPLLTSAFTSPDPYGLNESAVPQDGNALYLGFASLGSPVVATSAGVLITTLRFQALSPVGFTPVNLLVSGGSPVGFTTVYDSVVPNLDVTGTLSGGGVEIIPSPGVLGAVGLGLGASSLRRRRS